MQKITTVALIQVTVVIILYCSLEIFSHCQNLLRCFRKIVIDHCPDDTVNRIYDRLVYVLAAGRRRSRQGVLWRECRNQNQ